MSEKKGNIHHAFEWHYHAQPNWEAVEEAVIDFMDNGFRPHFYRLKHAGHKELLLISSKDILNEREACDIFNKTMGYES